MGSIMRLPTWPKSILNHYACPMQIFNTWNAILTHENHILDTKNRDSMYHGSKVIAKNLFRLLPMSAILDFVITKMPSGCNHNTHLIRKLHGTVNAKKELLPGKTRFWRNIGVCHQTTALRGYGKWGKMEHGSKMEQRVFRKKCVMCGSVVMFAWFPSLASMAWHSKIKPIDDHILNTTQKTQFSYIRSFWCINSSRSGVGCFGKVGYRTTESCYIEICAYFIYFHALLI